jgi:hypothetical protein
VNVLLEIHNQAKDNLGVSLPLGKVRVYKKGDDGALEFIGEDLISHTARDEKLVLHVGDAFDLVGERKQTEFRKLDKRHLEESFEIKLRNHKKEKVKVQVLEKFYRAREWKFVGLHPPFTPLDSRSVLFEVAVVPDQEAILTYKVEYRW